MWAPKYWLLFVKNEIDKPNTWTKRNMLTAQVYELWMCLLSSTVSSYRKESVFKPFPKELVTTHADIDQQFEHLSKLIHDMPTVSKLYPCLYFFCTILCSASSTAPNTSILSQEQAQLLFFIETTIQSKFSLHYISKKQQFDSLVQHLPTNHKPNAIFELKYHQSMHNF